MFLASNSLGSLYPSMRAAEALEKRQVPSASQPKIPSVAELSIKWTRSSTLCRASSVWTCIDPSSARLGNMLWILFRFSGPVLEEVHGPPVENICLMLRHGLLILPAPLRRQAT